MNKALNEFPGYDSFIVDDDMDLNRVLPDRIRPIDMKRFIEVDLTEMRLNGDAGVSTLRLRETGKAFAPATFEIFAYVVLAALNGRRKISTVTRWVDKLSHFSRDISNRLGGAKLTTMTLKMFNTYANGRSASQTKLLRSVLRFWHEQNVPGVEPALRQYLKVSRAPKPRSMIEIQNNVPIERPFSIPEVRAMLVDVEALYSDHRFDSQDYLLWRLIISEATRPSQLRLLQVGDIIVERDCDHKLVAVIVKMPIVKQAATAARDYMMDYQLSDPVARAMVDHLGYLTELYGSAVPSHFSLFCVRHKNGSAAPWISPEPMEIIARITTTRKLIAAASDDLDDLDLFTRRFKHTKLTHLAMLGAPLEVLARAGFQTSTVSLRRYVNLTDEGFALFEAQMATAHQRILQSFRGEVINRDAATHAEPENRIVDPTMEKSVGACADHPCDVLAPFGCYVCPRFEAFVDGPHERVEHVLVARRMRAIDMGLPPESVSRDDYLISAVRNVIAIVRTRD